MSATPGVGRIVHYVSHGTPIQPDGSQAYTAQCRAAVITEVLNPGDDTLGDTIGLCVLNPSGMFFHPGVTHEESPSGTPRTGGTWHWPERV